MYKFICTIIMIAFIVSGVNAQVCFSDHDYENLERQIKSNRKALQKSGKLSHKRGVDHPLLKWPMKQAEGFDDFSYYAITNYVDKSPIEDVLYDYQCQGRTYDGHRGTDIALSPFSWNKVAANQIEVIAAATGTIILKNDGSFDQQCEVDSTAIWNVLVLEHDDGSQTWYGHLKDGSITAKDSGDVVLQGEYIGIVASSGKSTGPHLHFEVKDSNYVTTDPFIGTCNPLGDDIWWENQLPYYDSGINKMMTSSQLYVNNPCPQVSQIFEEDEYEQGDPIVFSIHWRHELTDNSTTITAVEPDGDISPILNLVYVRAGSYHRSSFSDYWEAQIPIDAEKGKWKFKASYNTTNYGILNYEKEFWVKESCVANKILEGTHSVDRYYPTSNSLTSTAQVNNGVHIIYNPENYTTLNPGFRALPGSKVEIKTDGCN